MASQATLDMIHLHKRWMAGWGIVAVVFFIVTIVSFLVSADIRSWGAIFITTLSIVGFFTSFWLCGKHARHLDAYEKEVTIEDRRERSEARIPVIVKEVAESFRTFDPHNEADNPIALALEAGSPKFAAGVDVEEVIRFVLSKT